MSEPRWQDEIGRFVMTMQIIVGSLIAGVVFFAVIALFFAPAAGNAGGVDLLILTYAAMVFATVAIIARLVMPGMVTATVRKKIIAGIWPRSSGAAAPPRGNEFVDKHGDAARLIILYNTLVIFGAAVLEGATFFCLIAFMLGRDPLNLAMAIVLTAGMALGFPTRSRVTHWVEGQLNVLAQQRHLEG